MEINEISDLDRRQFIRTMIVTNDAWATRALMALYYNQTIEERDGNETRVHNGVGFNLIDSEVLTKLARFNEEHHYLTDRQLKVLKDRLSKYAFQLAKMSDKEKLDRLIINRLKEIDDEER